MGASVRPAVEIKTISDALKYAYTWQVRAEEIERDCRALRDRLAEAMECVRRYTDCKAERDTLREIVATRVTP